MKKILASALALTLVLSCSREAMTPLNPSENASRAFTISATVEDFATRVSFTPAYTGGKPASMSLAWAEGDKLRVYNHDDRSQYSDFDLKAECIGQTTGTFTGTLVPAASYDVEVIAGEFDYANQVQPADGVTTGLKYLASASGIAAADMETVSFTGFSSVLAITAKMPSSAVAATISSVDIKANEAIFNEGNTLSITLSEPGDADNDGILHLFATLPQGDRTFGEETTLIVKFNAPGTAHEVYTRFIPLGAGTFTANELNTININATKSDLYANYTTESIGGESNPYLVGDAYQMNALHGVITDESNTYVRMVDDVDLSGIAAWQPLVPSRDAKRNLHFDGDGHTISHLTAGTGYDFPSFVGFLWGEVHDVVFDHAAITCGNTKEQSGGVVSGYIGGGSYVGNCRNVTVSNSSVTTDGGSAYVGGLGGRVGNAGYFMNCHVTNTSVATTVNNGTNVGGMLSYIASNSALVIADCSAENISVTAGGHYAGGIVSQIASSNVVITRCHTSGEIQRSGSGRHFGGLVGSVQSADVTISYSYSACSITGYQFNGGLVGSWWKTDNFTGGSGLVEHCFASGKITDVGNSGDGGLIGTLDVPGVTVSNCIAWNEELAPNKYGEANYSTGAIVGRCHPNSILVNNYRKPGLNITAYWVPSANFDQPDSQLTGGTYYMWRIGTDLNESNGGYTTDTGFTSPNGVWAYHGKHLDSGITVTADDTYGWVSSAPVPNVPDLGQDDPENPAYTGQNVWNKGTTSTVVDGVTYTNFHGTWLDKTREINIVTTTLNAHNKLRIYYNYEDEGLLYLNEKCDYVNAVAATNGSMTSQYIRVHMEQKRAGKDDMSPWLHNCALTIEGDDVDIVKVHNNAEASLLSTNFVSCAGPLLVWKGNKLTASAEWLAADSEQWLTTGGNTGGQPRTAIGITKDGKKVIQVTVDGRWTSSNVAHQAYGMSTDELAELMLQLGCYKAMNLDGGGGSQMWVYDRGDVNHIVNHPHNTWPVYGTEGGSYYWSKTNDDGYPQVARRPSCSAVYVYSDLKN